MTKLRIALCITDLDLGGAEKCLAELAVCLDRGRFNAVVYCLGPRPELAEASCVPRLEAAGIEMHFLYARGILDFPRALYRLTRLLARRRPHLVQTFLFHANIVGRLAARRAGVRPVVCGLRVAERRSRWHLTADRLTSRLVDRYVCVSQAVAQFASTEGRLSPEKLVVIPNGIDVEGFPGKPSVPMTDFGIPAGHRVVVFVGRLEEQKGLPWFLETAPAWLGHVPDCDLLLVGKGPQRSMLERLAGQLGIADRVHFAGWRPDVPQILAASQILVLPSRWEGMPNVVLQAMASRLPVLSTDAEGVRELLGDAADPQTAPYGDTAGLAQKLVHILSNRVMAADLGRKNRLRAEQTFSLDRMVRSYEELWASRAAGLF